MFGSLHLIMYHSMLPKILVIQGGAEADPHLTENELNEALEFCEHGVGPASPGILHLCMLEFMMNDYFRSFCERRSTY